MRRFLILILLIGGIATIAYRVRLAKHTNTIPQNTTSSVDQSTPPPSTTPPITQTSGSVCGNGICEDNENTGTCSKDCCSSIYKTSEETCIERGWKKGITDVGGLPRRFLWKAPAGAWTNGVILALHGGGGTSANFCGDIGLNAPMGNFSEMAIANGFAVIAPDSGYNIATSVNGEPVGKRWASTEHGGANPDIDFLREVIRTTVPKLRPSGSNTSIFMTGISNGGFLTILAGTALDDKIVAFAPVSAGDPYGMHVGTEGDADLTLRGCAPGAFVDNETKKISSAMDACVSASYPNEKEWKSGNPSVKPPFKQFHNRGDAAVDISCMQKAGKQLIAHGYADNGAYFLNGSKNVLNHLWKDGYNQTLIDFFKKYVK